MSGLTVGDVLDVVATQNGRALAAQTSAGAIAGALTPLALVALLNCIALGRTYKAVVLQRKGGFCLVEIRPR